MLKRLQIRGLWSIAETNISMIDHNVALGANGAGKSSLLNTFRLLRALVSRGLAGFVAQQGGAGSMLHYGPKTTRHAELLLEFDAPKGPNGYSATLTYVAPDRLVFAEEMVWFSPGDGRATMKHQIGPGAHPESYLPLTLDQNEPATKVARVVKWNLDRFCHYHFHDTSSTAALRGASPVDDISFLHPDGSNLAPFLLSLRERESQAYERIRFAISRVFPRFDDFVLEPSSGSPPTVQLRWRERGNEYIFGPHHLSDGTLRFIALCAVLLQPGSPADKDHPNFPIIIVIDEPELGLHPAALAILGGLFRQTQAQSLVATQSVEMLGHLITDASELPRLILVERGEAAGSILRRADPVTLKPWLEDYSPQQLWTHGILGALP